jgi:hypothetical protein
MNHLKNEKDSTHKAILVYLTKLASFQQGPARKNPSKNSFYAVPLPQPALMTQAGDIWCGTTMAMAGPMSHTNENNNEVEGKVGGGGMAGPGWR